MMPNNEQTEPARTVSPFVAEQLDTLENGLFFIVSARELAGAAKHLSSYDLTPYERSRVLEKLQRLAFREPLAANIRSRLRTAFLTGGFFFCFSFVLGLGAGGRSVGAYGPPPPLDINLYASCGIGLFFGLVAFALTNSATSIRGLFTLSSQDRAVRTACISALGRIGYPEAIEPLVEFHHPDQGLRDCAHETLRRLLHRAAEGDGAELPAYVSVALARRLPHLGLKLARLGLEALSHAGSPAALPHLDPDNFEDHGLLALMYETIGVLRRREQEHAQRDTLLRPTSNEEHLLSPAPPSSDLLHLVQSDERSDPAVLLRPNTGDV